MNFDGQPDECITRALSASAAVGGNHHAAYVNEDGNAVELTYDAATSRWLVTEYGDLTEATVRRVESFIDARDNLGYIAVASDDGVRLLSPDLPAAAPRNLTSELPGSTTIVGSSTIITSKDGLTFLAGMNVDGDLVLYFQTGQTDAQGRQLWAYTNLYTDHLEPQGASRPAFVGDLVSYVTSWNGLNIAGLDADGTIWSVWWAPGMTLWTSSNLSEITGAEPIVGTLTAYVTSWDGLNLAGLNANGQVVVTWWVPEFDGQWSKNNLSQQFNHPGLKVGELTSYVTSWGGLNIAGLDQDGRLVVYWWSPELTEWQVSPLSALVPGAPLPASSVRGLAAPTGMLSIFAFTSEDEGRDVVRYFWEPNGQWQAQNVSEIAVPR